VKDSDSNTSDNTAEWKLQSSGMWCCIVWHLGTAEYSK
jgi:hypothetical protein